MTAAPSFDEFIRRIRSGDQQAATELVRQYEPTVRRVIRFRLGDARLGAAFDSLDVCQSVLGSFFVRAAAGQFDLTNPEQLVKLLATMARNKLASQVRKERAGCRDRRRVVSPREDAPEVAGVEATPSRQCAARELLQQVYRRLTPEERKLAEMRSQGHDWAVIAAETGQNAPALRQRLSRALNRVSQELGLEQFDDE
jgi:RNA polymerase sigma-70 factor (ECF subfamily)